MRKFVCFTMILAALGLTLALSACSGASDSPVVAFVPVDTGLGGGTGVTTPAGTDDGGGGAPTNPETPQTASLKIPLTFEAFAAGTVVTFENKASGPVSYKVNGADEGTIASGQKKNVALPKVGDCVSFYGDNEYYCIEAEDGSIISSNFSFSLPCYVYGNIMSLVSSADFESASEVSENAFRKLFLKSCIMNKRGADLFLPATKLGERCYSSMFYDCTSLTAAPELPATELAEWCYSSMFEGCTSLTAAPELPATELAEWCYCDRIGGEMLLLYVRGMYKSNRRARTSCDRIGV